MKIVTTINWSLIGVGAIVIVCAGLTADRYSDPATRGLGVVYMIGALIVLAAISGLNLFPFRLTRIAVLVLLTMPIVVSLYVGVNRLVASQQQKQADDARANGSYYFTDDLRRELAGAISRDDDAEVKMLLQHPLPQLNESGAEHLTLLDFAVIHAAGMDNPQPALACLNLLLKKGATFETRDPLHVPTHVLVGNQGSAALLDWFLKNGADPNAKRNALTPMIFVVMDVGDQRLEKVKLLVEYGADLGAQYPDPDYEFGWTAHYTPLLYAAHLQCWDICELLLKKGANPAYRTPKGVDFRTILEGHEKSFAATGEIPAAFTALKQTLLSI